MRLLILFLLLPFFGAAQLTYYIRSDSTKIEKNGGSNELFIKNATRGINGVLTNVGGGKTRFIASKVSGDTLFIGMDTLLNAAGAAGSSGGQDRYLYYPIVFDQYAFRDSTIVDGLAGITSNYFNDGLVLKGSTTPITSSYIRAWNYGYLINENTSQRLVFQVLDSATTLEIGLGIKGSGQVNPRDQYSYITGTLGDSANTDLISIQTTAGPTQTSSGVLINKGDFIEITVNQWADSVVTFYRNISNNNSIKLVRPILSTNSGSSTRMGYPTVFFGNGHVRLVDWSIYQPDFDIMIIGNSITTGHHASAFDTAFVSRLQNKTASKINNTARSAATTIDYTHVKNDFNFRNKVVIISGLIGNDPQGGLTAAQSKAYYEQVVAKLKSNGNTVVHTTVTYRTTFMGSATWADFYHLNLWLDTAYGAVDKVIHLDTITAAMLDDGVHLNDAGMATVYNSIYRDASEYFERGYNPQTVGRTPIYGSSDGRIPYDSSGVFSSSNRMFWNRSNNSFNVNGITVHSSLTTTTKYLQTLVGGLSGNVYVAHPAGQLGLVIQRQSADLSGANLYFFKATDFTALAGYIGITGVTTYASPTNNGTIRNHYQVFNQAGVVGQSNTYSGLFFSSSDTTTSTLSVTNGFTYNTMTHFLRGAGLSVTNKGFDQTTLQTFNTTSGALTNYMYHTTNTATRSSGANDLTNVGIYVKANRAQLNYGIVVDSGSVGIGTVTPVPSAALDITSTTQGFLPPRLTTTQQGSIASPATGLVIYNTDSAALCHYNGSAWRMVDAPTTTVASTSNTPAVTGITNVDNVSASQFHWIRVGNVVSYSGFVNIDATAAGVATSVEVTLAYSSNFANNNDAAGVVTEGVSGATQSSGYIYSNSTSDKIVINVTPQGTAAQGYYVSGSYKII